MNGLKILFNRWFSHKIFFTATLILFVGMMTAVMIFHEDPGNYESDEADYLMCKICALLPMVLGITIPSILTANEVVGSRFMRAIPAADRMFRVGFPLFGLLISLGWGLAINLIYAAFILISGRDICNISDMLLLTAPFALFCTFIPAFMFSSRFGAVAGMFMYFLFMFLMWGISSLSEQVKYDGFGIPVWESALITLAAYAVGFAIGWVISWACYRKGNFRELEYGGLYRK
ncbi:MAG: hypothetical protein J6A19_06885 [Oscillospiraceae bacterium]|nr:hypothetical protein [Oscillospiraceae bacterium]